MSLTGQNITESDIERYILAEMDEDERAAFDEQALADDKLFFEAADLEDRLVDSYVAGTLAGETLTRFERSLDAVPGRRQKVANARSLKTYIDEERGAEAASEIAVEKVSMWNQIAGLFSGRSALASIMAAAVVLLAVAAGLLLLENQRKSTELARLEDVQQRQAELQNQLEESRRHEGELRSSIDAERDASGDLQDELDRERLRREEIERELGKLKPANNTQPGPIIASVVLSPFGGRDTGSGGPGKIKVGPETKRVSLRLSLPDEVEAGSRLTVKLNQKTIAADIAARVSGRKRSINVTVPMAGVKKGRNDIDVFDSGGDVVANYRLEVVEK